MAGGSKRLIACVVGGCQAIGARLSCMGRIRWQEPKKKRRSWEPELGPGAGNRSWETELRPELMCSRDVQAAGPPLHYEKCDIIRGAELHNIMPGYESERIFFGVGVTLN